MLRDLRFGTTVAVGWPWSCFFFLSLFVGSAAGWPGLVVLALPSIVGLAIFGFVVGRHQFDPGTLFPDIQKRFAGLLITYQVLLLAATMFAVWNYFFLPLLGPGAVPIAAVLVLSCVAFAHAASVKRMQGANMVALAIGLVATALLLLSNTPLPASAAPKIVEFSSIGLFVPLVLASAIVPWIDVRHWHQAIEIKRSGGSIRRAYLVGMALTALMFAINGALAMHLGPAAQSGATPRIYDVSSHLRLGYAAWPLAAFSIWVGVSIAPTITSCYAALSMVLKATTEKSNSPLLVMIPAGIVQSPLWIVAATLLMVQAATSAKLDVVYVLMPFATIVLGLSACIFLEALGRRRDPDHVLSSLIGGASLLIFVSGYAGQEPALIMLAPFVGLIGALPTMTKLPMVAATAAAAAPASNVAIVAVTVVESVGSHGFDDQWFVLHITPTYDDTNSVGNVYFANYFRWVGKTRELFFNACMPDFDLADTDFYVLTKSFHHEFRREIREFQPVTVRIRIGSYNRKFVKLIHEIHSRTEGIIGRGEQSIMFVDKAQYRPLDIPSVILQRFLPYYTPNA